MSAPRTTLQEKGGRPGGEAPRSHAHPRRRRTWAAIVAALVFLAAIGVGAAFYLDQKDRLDAAEAAREAAIVELEDALDALDTSAAEVAALEGRIERLQERLGTAGTSAEELEARLLALTGQPLPDGRHFGYLKAVGATQDPPYLVIDVAIFLTDEAADEAAREAGEMPPGEEHVPNGYFIVNDNPRWRIVEIDPGADVTLTTYPYADPSDPTTVSLARFDELFALGEHGVTLLPYWITVQDGEVIAIEQQFLP